MHDVINAIVAVSWAQGAAVALGSGGLIALAVTIANAWLGVRTERRRTQPVVICHEHRGRSFASNATGGDWQVDVWLTNEGGGSAFNVRFGVEMRGVRFPFRGQRAEGDPHRYRVVRQGEQMPEAAQHVPIFLDDTETWGLVDGSGQTIDDGRSYWCRYENAHGHTWETINPADPTKDLRIRRVRVSWWRDRRERRALVRVRRDGAARERRAVEELRAGMEQANAETEAAPQRDE